MKKLTVTFCADAFFISFLLDNGFAETTSSDDRLHQHRTFTHQESSKHKLYVWNNGDIIPQGSGRSKEELKSLTLGQLQYWLSKPVL